MNMRLFAGVMAVFSCGLAITIVSCSGDNIADAPGQPARDGNNPRVLAGECSGILAVERCAAGGASASYDPLTGVLSVTNSTDENSGLKSTFADANSWHQFVEADAPNASGERISAVAYNNEARQARFDIKQDAADPNRLALTSAFDAGNGIYDVVVYNDGEEVGRQDQVGADAITTVGGFIAGRAEGGNPSAFGKTAWSIRFRFRVGFKVINVHIWGKQQQKNAQINSGGGEVVAGACAWTLGSSAGDAVDVTLPNGTVLEGDEIRLVEHVDGSGRYPYHSVNRVDLLSNGGTFDVLSEQASN